MPRLASYSFHFALLDSEAYLDTIVARTYTSHDALTSLPGNY